MGATPLYFTLALSLPSVDKKWLADFSQSLKALAKQYNISLVGGDKVGLHPLLPNRSN
jgi:thiamine-monophosphate kinase